MGKYYPMIHVVEQSGFYHSVGETGERVCESSKDLAEFVANLSGVVRSSLSFRRDGDPD